MTLTNLILQQLQDPTNREIVNNGQDEFEFEFLDYPVASLGIYGAGKYSSKLVIHVDVTSIEALCKSNKNHQALFFCFFRHCINLLPCFDVENPEYTKANNRYLGSLKLAKDILPSDATYTNRQAWLAQDQASLAYIPKTIRQALLTCGAMDLEELEKYALDNNLIDNI